MSRRQNSSCDQCRKGKRACDAVWLRDRQLQRPLDEHAAPGLDGPNNDKDINDVDLLGPCTNCARTNKQCTFEWVQSQQLFKKRERQNTANSLTSAHHKKPSTTLAPPPIGSHSPSTIPLRSLRPSLPPTHSFDANPPYHNILLDDIAFVDGHLTSAAPAMGIPDVLPPTDAPYMDVSAVLSNYSLDPFSTGPPAPHHQPGPFNDGFALDTTTAVSNVWSSPASAVVASPPADPVDSSRKRRRTQSPARTFQTPPAPVPPWALYPADRLARSTNGNMIGETMMKIYHDVMEGALSCWLTEQTCPYNSLPATPSSSSTLTENSSSGGSGSHNNNQSFFWATFEDMQREWGPNWSNRVYRRVIKLDRVSHLLGLKRLSPADEKKVSSALNLAVMAFTAQWAQASQRGSAQWPAGTDDFGQAWGLDLNEEFDRTLQKSFWNQARRALDDCSEVDSFRLVFAEIIFGLTQKYADTSTDPADVLFNPDHQDIGATTEALEDILRQDTQQIWLERATRRLQVLRRRVELYDRQQRPCSNKRDGGKASLYDAECRKTIDLLYWLAVMFDTISAAMTERPLTVSDEDSSNLSLTNPHQAQHAHSATSGDPSKRWNVILVKDQQTKMTPARWPCSDEVIASELTDAAPVKVLLYRKVTRLQTLIARDADAATLEETINDGMLVYHHWTTYYSALFRDCIDHHLYLSSRIQSWYVCLFGHWLLATLLLADLVEMAARRGGGYPGRDIQARAIRKSSVRLVSDLARTSTPRHESGLGELDNFHHAVNEGALLTEPWTMILIRTFSRAAVILLEGHYGSSGDETQDDGAATGLSPEEADEEKDQDERGDFQRCADCVKALWYLGRKSDMARQIANVLSVALQRARVKAGASG